MDIFLARESLNSKPEKITLTKIKEFLKENPTEILYFDSKNSHKNMVTLVEKLENEGYNVYFKEIKFGLGEDEYIYELHAL